MNKRKYQSLVKRAVRAYRMETGEYEHIMDEAGQLLDWPENMDDTDTEWERFCKDVEEGCKVPLTPREQKMVDNRKKREELEAAKNQAIYAQRFYESMLAKNKQAYHA